MATERPEMTPQETLVSTGGAFPRSLLHSVTGWRKPVGCGSDGHQRPPLSSQIPFSTRSAEQPIMVPMPSLSEGVSGVKYSSPGGLELGS